MAGRPLGISDLYAATRLRYSPYALPIDDCWYWCRAEHPDGTPHGAERWVDATRRECIRIGPFMSEREANRLGEVMTCTGNNTGAHHRNRPPLGMEVERDG